MKKLFVTLFTTLFCLTSSVGYSEGEKFKDIDWNMTFFDNCGFSSTSGDKQNLRWMEENENKFLRFTLHNKQVGKCRSDTKERNGAPYWERAELKQVGTFKKKSTYEINYKFRLIEGYNNKEIIFQIHGFSSGKCNAPIALLQLRGKKRNLRLLLRQYQSNRKDTVKNLIKDSDWSKYKLSTKSGNKIFAKDIMNKWSTIKFLINFDDINGKLDMFFNDEKIEEDLSFDTLSCDTPHIKFGLYRAGNDKKRNVSSVIDYDKFSVNKIK